MKRYRKTTISQYIVIGIFLTIVLSIGLTSFILMQRLPFNDHFVIPWAAGRAWLLEGLSPYDQGVIDVAETSINASGYQAVLPSRLELITPVMSLVFYLPLSLLPYPVSRVIWVTLLIIGIVLIGYLSLLFSEWKISKFEHIFAIVLIIIWLPTVYSAISGRIEPLIILIMLLSIKLIMSGQESSAGFLMALTAGSLPISILVLILLITWSISHRKWAFITAFLSAFTFLIAIFTLMLPDWPLDWFGNIFGEFQDWNWIETPIMELATILPGIAYFLSISLHVIFIIYTIYLIISASGKSNLVFIWKTAAILTVSFLLHVQGDLPHLFLVIPAMFLVYRFLSERWQLVGKLVSWGLFLLFFIGPWFLILPELNMDRELRLNILFIGLPILIIGSLIWLRWWAMKIPHLHYEM